MYSLPPCIASRSFLSLRHPHSHVSTPQLTALPAHATTLAPLLRAAALDSPHASSPRPHPITLSPSTNHRHTCPLNANIVRCSPSSFIAFLLADYPSPPRYLIMSYKAQSPISTLEDFPARPLSACSFAFSPAPRSASLSATAMPAFAFWPLRLPLPLPGTPGACPAYLY
jgi:hypothetical protein